MITLSVLTYAKIINLSWILKVFNFLDISVTLLWIAILFLDVLRYWSSNMTILYQIVTTKRTFHYWKKNWLYPGYLLDMSQKPRSLPPQSTRALTSSFLSSSSLVLTSSLSVSDTTLLLLLWLWLEWPSWLWFNSRFFRPAKKFVCLPNPNS